MDFPQTPFTGTCPWCGQLLTRDNGSALMTVAPGELFVASDPHQCPSSQSTDSADC